MAAEPPATAMIMDQIHRLASRRDTEERLTLIQAIADMEPGPATKSATLSAQRRDQLTTEQATW